MVRTYCLIVGSEEQTTNLSSKAKRLGDFLLESADSEGKAARHTRHSGICRLTQNPKSRLRSLSQKSKRGRKHPGHSQAG